MLQTFLGFEKYLLNHCHRLAITVIVIWVFTVIIVVVSIIIIIIAIVVSTWFSSLIIINSSQQTFVETASKFLYSERKLHRTDGTDSSIWHWIPVIITVWGFAKANFVKSVAAVEALYRKVYMVIICFMVWTQWKSSIISRRICCPVKTNGEDCFSNLVIWHLSSSVYIVCFELNNTMYIATCSESCPFAVHMSEFLSIYLYSCL